jgi:hypothetical protein
LRDLLRPQGRKSRGAFPAGAGGIGLDWADDRKIRFGGKGKGKSGGFRVISFYSGADIPVFLLNVFAKNEKTDLTKAERNEFKATLTKLAAAYRGKK